MPGRSRRHIPRRIGVEEELLLLDEAGAPAPCSLEIVRGDLARPAEGRAHAVQEFFQAQVELVTSPTASLDALGEQLSDARHLLAVKARQCGVDAVAVPGPVLDTSHGPLVPSERFDEVRRAYGKVASESLMCALQVHVEVDTRDEGVAVLDRVRPWVPLLLAVSANSPFWHGQDTGHASWRSHVWRSWPSAGPVELLGSVAAYDTLASRMIDTGAALDEALLNLDVRLSARYPTVEWRVADVCTDPDDTLLVAALARGLTETAAREARGTKPPAHWRVDHLRAAAWLAGRDGAEGQLLHPHTGTRVAAKDALLALRDHVAEALDDAGDLGLVEAGLERLHVAGGGAARQRSAHAVRGRLDDVLTDLKLRTTARPSGGLDQDRRTSSGVEGGPRSPTELGP
jgi:carboxylate-amine ligase